jgi:catechol 2,3-dioxygenase-like lactoylglutathione lyase family enzyme
MVTSCSSAVLWSESIVQREMAIKRIIPQLRTANLASSIDFYTEKLGFVLDFKYEDFYAGIRYGDQAIHLKFACDRDPSIRYVDEAGHLHLYFDAMDVDALADWLKNKGVPMVRDVHDTAWQTREFVIHDDQGHTLYFGEPL